MTLLPNTGSCMSKKFNLNQFRLVKVKWHDPCDFETGWNDLKKVQAAKTEPVVSVGWLITDNADRIVLSADFCSDGTTGRAIAITRACCENITTLEVGKD